MQLHWSHDLSRHLCFTVLNHIDKRSQDRIFPVISEATWGSISYDQGFIPTRKKMPASPPFLLALAPSWIVLVLNICYARSSYYFFGNFAFT